MVRPSLIKNALIVVAAATSFGVVGEAGASAITWGTPTDYSGDTDVVNTGSTVYAFDFGGSPAGAATSTTINGVSFSAFDLNAQNSVTDGGLTVSETNASTPIDGTYGKTFGNLSSAYNAMLANSVSDATVESIDVDATGLTPGASYEVEIWSNLLANGDGTQVSDGITNGPNLDNGVGQFVTGTFVASGTTQNVYLSGTGNEVVGPVDFGPLPVLTGYQLREISPVPEPTALAMLAMGGGALLLRRRRRATSNRAIGA